MEPPNKKTKKRPVSKTKASSNANDNEDIPKAEKINIDNLIAQAFTRHKFEKLLSEKKEKFKEITHLATIAEEYLSCFSLIGYTFQGEKVCVFNAANSKDEAALVDLLRSTFLEIANNRP
jgi:hypothetical protein